MLQIVNGNDINKIALPTTLYKYRTLQECHLDILINNVVYFAAPNSFDDPKDCRPPENYPDEQTVYNYLWKQSVKDNQQISFKAREHIVNKQLKNSPILDVNRRKELIDNLFIEYCSCHGVLSVTANCENEKMWDDYADGHKGICIGFDSQKLASISGGGGQINYCDELPHVNILKDSIEEEHIKRVYYKELKWKYEEEYRLHKTWQFSPDHPIVVDRKIKLPNNSITSIICGKHMPLDKVEYIKAIVAAHQPQADLIIK